MSAALPFSVDELQAIERRHNLVFQESIIVSAVTVAIFSFPLL
jgi:hypothetical protein